jgi:hypothetical protein
MSIAETVDSQGVNKGVAAPWYMLLRAGVARAGLTVLRRNDNYLCVPFGSSIRLSWVEKDPASAAWSCLDLYDTGEEQTLVLLSLLTRCILLLPFRLRALPPLRAARHRC